MFSKKPKKKGNFLMLHFAMYTLVVTLIHGKYNSVPRHLANKR